MSAQGQLSVKGRVTDSIGGPIANAAVTIIDEAGTGLFFGKTDEKGAFKCHLVTDSYKLSIKVTCLGFHQQTVPLGQLSDQPYTIVLKQTMAQLKEIIVKSDNSIKLSSDTLKYKVKAFRDQQDRVIADLINRLPGIQVDERGAISYNGKPIKTIYIDGDNLLDEKYGIATKTMPVGAVDQVEVIERDQPVKALNGFVTTNDISLNLKLSDSAKTVIFNTGHVGSGNKAYTAELNNIILKKGIKSMNTVKANNVGLDLLNENADIGVSFDNEVGLKTVQPYLSLESTSHPTVDDKYYLKNNDLAGGINTLFKPGADWGLRLNIYSLKLKRKYRESSLVNYFLPNTDTIGYEEIQNNIYRSEQWQFKGQVEKNSRSVYIRSTTRLDLPKWDRSGTTIQNDSALSQHQPSRYISLSNETSAVKGIGSNQVIQYNGLVQYYQMRESLNIHPGVQEAVVNNSLPYQMLEQQMLTKTVFIDQSFWLRSKLGRLVVSTSLGTSFEHNNLSSNLYKTSDDQRTTEVGNDFRNNTDLDHTNLHSKTSLMYVLPGGWIMAEADPSFHVVRYTSMEKGFVHENLYFLLNPLLEYRKKFALYNEFNLRYAQRTEFGQIQEIYPGTILVNYRQFSANNTPLPKNDVYSLMARYTYRKPIQVFFCNLSINYDHTSTNFINSYVVERGLTKTTAIDYRNRMNRFSINGNISKYLFFAGVNLAANGGWGLRNGYGFYNDEVRPFITYDANLAFTASKKLVKEVTLSMTGEISEFNNIQQTTQSENIRNETVAYRFKSEWRHSISDHLSYLINYHVNAYRQKLQKPVSNHFLDAEVRYRPSKCKCSFELQCVNLLNQHLYRQTNAYSNQLSVAEIPLRGRTFLLTCHFNL
ncbi:carboxypeptidase-like regulatory domain-containing protein [Chitinophaga costaii]|uniref:carboxypeptidase-like regulatory domain-containing protein n=1 Tax=Chitinophaga costaii TaxID=1335309 RepID=UPI0013FD76ED|nr:carboxypeptidase-like regulatory domain-containing protein [Chitinophaga costaii]